MTPQSFVRGISGAAAHGARRRRGVGRGKPFFAGPPPPLRLVATDLVGEDTVRLIYAPA